MTSPDPTRQRPSRAYPYRIALGERYPDTAARLRALWWFWWTDHAWIRAFWPNLDQVAPGVWRSNQPSPRRFARFRDMGIRTIITLRGDSNLPHSIFEKNSCAHHGINLVPIHMRARNLCDRQIYLELLDNFETLEKPFLMHCKSGADRVGLASALYLLHIENAPLEQARKQLSLRYAHVRSFRTGILDFMLERYGEDISDRAMPIRDWIATEFDRKALTAEFELRRSQGRF